MKLIQQEKQEDIDKGNHRERWSVLTCFWTALVIVLISAVSVTILMHKPVWVELETLAAIVGILMTCFYTYLLYHGIQFSKDETLTFRKTIGEPLDLAQSGIDFGHFTAAGASEGPAGLLLGFMLDVVLCIVLSIVLSLLIWLGINLLVVGVIAIAIPLFYIFKRSVFFVMRHVEECHGNLLAALRYGFGYAAVKTITLCFIIFGSHELANLIKTNFLES
jgi:hypothetical protein